MAALHFILFIVFCINASTNLIAANSVLQVRTDVGTFEGFVSDVDYNSNTRPLVQFLGIPYAVAPTGQRRFAKPEPKATLEGVYNATYYRPACPQARNVYYPDAKEYSEDCLYLNIYVPGDGMNISNYKFPVMIWIYGGGFTSGYSHLYIPDALSTSGDVIVVTLNYRVALFGFLTTGDYASVGNYGLWDQHLAIKWIYNHISNFGGDPETVTLFGGSAGAVSVLLQAMFPGNMGLFRRIVAESGSPLMLSETPQAPLIGPRVGCVQTNSTQLVECLRSKDMKTLVDVLNHPSSARLLATFFPNVDGDFIKLHPKDSLQNKSSEEYKLFSSLDLLAGVNDFEGYLNFDISLRFVLGLTDENFPVTTFQFNSLIVPSRIQQQYGDNVPSYLTDAVIFQYTDWKKVGNVNSTRDMVMQLMSDTSFYLPTIETLDIHERDTDANSTTFLYLFTVPGYLIRNRPPWLTGAAHGDEVFFVFGMSKGIEEVYNLTASPEDIAVGIETMKLFTNFAKTGNPNKPVQPRSTLWPHYVADTRDYVEIGSTSTVAKQRFNEPYTTFWTYMVPSLLRHERVEPTTISTTTPPTTSIEKAGTTTATKEKTTEKTFSDRFNIDSTTADNVIIILIVVSGVLLLLCFTCCVIVIRQNKSESKFAF